MFKAQESGWRNTKTTDHLHTVKGLVRTLLDVVWYAPFEVGFCTAGQGLTDRSWEGRVRLSEHKISQWKLGWQRYRGLFGSIALFVPDCHVPACDGVTPLPTISTDPQCLPQATWKEIWTWVDTTLQESSAGKNTRKKFSSRIYLRAGQFKARKKFSSLM